MLLRPARTGPVGAETHIALAYLGGTLAGATTSALGLWLLAGFAEPLPAPGRWLLLALGTLLVAAIKIGPLAGRIRLPEARRQIPASVFGGSLARGAFRFGAELGTGMRTYAPTMAPYLLVLALLLSRPTLGAALCAGAGFGLGRALPVMVRLGAADRLQATLDYARGMRRLPDLATAVTVLLGALAIV
ncbi:MAG: hypothetical protein AAGC60_24660 [Acidobacteriota bacterium]